MKAKLYLQPNWRVTSFAIVALTLISGKAEATAYTQANPINYTFLILDNNLDPNFNQLLSIDNAGYIAGYYGDGTVVPNNGYVLAPPYGQANYTAENFPGATQTQVTGINNTLTNGTYNTVGFYVDNAGANHGFKDIGGSFTQVDNPNVSSTPPVNQLLGLNDKNTAVGFYNDSAGNAHAYAVNLTTNSFTALLLPGAFNAVSVTATDANNSGDISGFYTDKSGVVHGFLDLGGMFMSLDDPNGNGTNTSFFGLNNNGDLVGSFVDAKGTNGLLYDWLTKTWLTIDDPNASFTTVFGVNGTTINGINDLGQMVGFYSDGTRVNGVLINSPSVPEPASLNLTTLTGFGAGLVVVAMRRKKTKT